MSSSKKREGLRKTPWSKPPRWATTTQRSTPSSYARSFASVSEAWPFAAIGPPEKSRSTSHSKTRTARHYASSWLSQNSRASPVTAPLRRSSRKRKRRQHAYPPTRQGGSHDAQPPHHAPSAPAFTHAGGLSILCAPA